MKDQVTTIEQSQRLLELGVPAEKASMVYMNNADFPSFRAELASAGIDLKELVGDGHEYTPAYTVADLLGMMPWEIEVKNSVLPKFPGLRLNNSEDTPFRFKVRKDGVVWVCKYTSYGIGKINEIFEESRAGVNLIDPTRELIEWLVSNGYKLEL